MDWIFLLEKGLSIISENLIIIFILIYMSAIFWMFKIRNQSFFSSDIKPNLFPYSNLSLDVDVETILHVKTGIFVQGFPTFDLNRNILKINCIVWFKFNRAQVSAEMIENFAFLNATNVQKKLIETSINNNDIILQYTVQVEFFSNLNQIYFPFNDHSVYLVMFHPEYTAQQLMYEVVPESIELAQDLQMQDWEIIGASSECGFDYVSISEISKNREITHSRVLYTFNIKKTGLRKVLLITAPLILILLLSSSSILYPANGLSVAVGSITGILAYRYVINNMSPNVGYFTLGEYIYNYCLVFICATFLIFLYTLYNNMELSQNIRHLWFYLVNTSIVAYLFYILFFFKAHNSLQQKMLHEKCIPPLANTWDLEKLTRAISRYQRYASILSFFGIELNPILSMPKLFNYLEIYETDNQTAALKTNSKIILCTSIVADHDEIIFFLKTLINLKLLNKNLELCAKENFLIINQVKLEKVEDLKFILPIVLILKQKNPRQVFFLQSHSEIMKLIQDPVKNNDKHNLYQKYQQEFLSKIDAFFKKIQNLHTFKYPNNCLLHFSHYLDIAENNSNEEIYLCNLDKDTFFNVNQHLLAGLPKGTASVWYHQYLVNQERGLIIINFQKFCKLNLYWQNQKNETFNQQSCQAQNYYPASKKFKKSLILPAIMGLSGALASNSSKIMKGVFLGYQNKSIDLEIALRMQLLDDSYQPDLTNKHLLSLFNQYQEPFIILTTSGTAPSSCLLPYIQNKKILLMFPITGAASFRQPELSNVIHFRASYEKEVLTLIRHAIEVKGCKKIAIFYQNDPGGLALLNPAKLYLDAIGIEYHKFPYQRNSPNVAPIADEIKKNPPDCIFFFSNAAPSVALVSHIGAAKAANIQLFAVSTAAEALSEFVRSIGLNLTFTRLVPYLDDNLEIIHRFKSCYQEKMIATSFSKDVLEGFIMGSIFKNVLQQTNGDCRIAAILETIQAYKDYNFQGLNLNYNPETQEIFNQIYLDDTSSKQK